MARRPLRVRVTHVKSSVEVSTPDRSQTQQPPTKRARVVATIFGQDRDEISREILKRILTMFHQNVPYRQLRRTLVERVIALEETLTANERLTITQVLGQGDVLTQAALQAGPQAEVGIQTETKGKTPTVDDVKSTLHRALDQLYECQICFEEMQPNQFPNGKLTPICEHESLICNECLGSDISNQLTSKAWETICCPFCPELLPAALIQTHAAGDVLDNYKAFQRTFHMRNEEKFRWCLGPGCRSGVVHGWDDRRPKITCKDCGFQTCFTCQKPWHDGLSCDENQESLISDEDEDTAAASKKTINPTIKPCPGCKVRTEKIVGLDCGNVSCPQCERYWYWGHH